MGQQAPRCKMLQLKYAVHLWLRVAQQSLTRIKLQYIIGPESCLKPHTCKTPQHSGRMLPTQEGPPRKPTRVNQLSIR